MSGRVLQKPGIGHYPRMAASRWAVPVDTATERRGRPRLPRQVRMHVLADLPTTPTLTPVLLKMLLGLGSDF